MGGLAVTSSLTHLNVSCNALATLRGAVALRGLARLNVQRNCLTTLEDLQGLTSLQHLDAGANSITSLQALTGLTGLRELLLHRNKVSDPAEMVALGALPHLAKLALYGNPALLSLGPRARAVTLATLRGRLQVRGGYPSCCVGCVLGHLSMVQQLHCLGAPGCFNSSPSFGPVLVQSGTLNLQTLTIQCVLCSCTWFYSCPRATSIAQILDCARVSQDEAAAAAGSTTWEDVASEAPKGQQQGQGGGDTVPRSDSWARCVPAARAAPGSQHASLQVS